MKTIVILFALLCVACIAGEVIAEIADDDDEEVNYDDEEYK